MWVWIEPLLGWVALTAGVVGTAVAVMFGKKLARWAIRELGEGIADAIGDRLEPRWTKGIRTQIDEALQPSTDAHARAQRWMEDHEARHIDIEARLTP